jgi:quercetin dioxygenase-like cupin family protein
MRMKLTLIIAASLMVAGAPAAAALTPTTRSSMVFDRPLPNVPGKSLRGVLVEYGPGGASPAHTHAPSAFIYATVLEGAVRSKVGDGPERTYQVGENFYENPGDRHGVSANASATAPAKLLAVFVVDTAETTLTVPTP